MGLLTTAFLVANLALQANPPKSVADTPNNSYPLVVTKMVVVTIDDQGKTYINKNPVDREQLLSVIKQLYAQEPKIVFGLNPSEKALLLDIVKIMIMMQSEGVEMSLAQPHVYSPPVKALDNMPKSNPKLNLGKVLTPGSLVIGIDDAGKTYINENSIEQAELSWAIKQQYDQEPKTAFLINATSQTRYDDAAQVMGVMRSVGVKSTTLNIVLPHNQSNISLPVNICSEPVTLMPPSASHPRPYVPCLQPASPDR